MVCSSTPLSCCETSDDDIGYAVVPIYFSGAMACAFHVGGGYLVTAGHNMIEQDGSRSSSWSGYVIKKGELGAHAKTFSYVGIDAALDIGVLFCDIDVENWPCLEFTNSREKSPGDIAKLCGFPIGVDINSLSSGVIRDPMFCEPDSGNPVEIMLVDTPAYSGNSGSPILDSDNKVIGVFTHSYGKPVGVSGGGSFFDAANSIGGGCASYIVKHSVQKIINSGSDYTYKSNLSADAIYIKPSMSEAIRISNAGDLARGFVVKASGKRFNNHIIEGLRLSGDTNWTCVGWSPGCILPGSFLWHLDPGTTVEALFRDHNNVYVESVVLEQYNSVLDCVWCVYTSSSKKASGFRPVAARDI